MELENTHTSWSDFLMGLCHPSQSTHAQGSRLAKENVEIQILTNDSLICAMNELTFIASILCVLQLVREEPQHSRVIGIGHI